MVTCRLCKTSKPPSEFAPRYHPDNPDHPGRPICRSCITERQRDGTYASCMHYIRARYRDTKQRARRKKIHFDSKLTVDDLLSLFKKQGGCCAITGLPMTWGREQLHSNDGSRRGTNISLDRLDVRKGYTIKNLRLVCDRANKMRSNMNDDDLYFWASQIANNLRRY